MFSFSITSAFIFFSRVVVGVDSYTATNVTGCPTACNCSLMTSVTSLTVDCARGVPDVNQLSSQLDSLLSARNIVERVTSLSITNTPLTRVPASVCQLLNLTSLHLDRNNLTKLPDNCFDNLTNLVSLSAAHNSIDELQDGIFDNLDRLKALSLTSNRISRIGLRVFSNASLLTSLVDLDLSHNHLTSIEPWPYIRGLSGTRDRPVKVDLQFNLLSSFTNRLGWNSYCHDKGAYLRLRLDQNGIRYISDITSGWNMSDFATLTCVLNFRNDANAEVRIALAWNSIICDCVDYKYYAFGRINQRSSYLSDVRCYNLNYAHAYALPLDAFFCNMTSGCPPKCDCEYRPANATLHVRCSAANLSSLPRNLPPLPKSFVKYSLDFSNNKFLRGLKHRPYFANTTVLDVRVCAIESIDQDAWQAVVKISDVRLDGNRMESIPRNFSSVPVLSRSFTLKDNPWKCSCKNRWMSHWLSVIDTRVSNEEKYVLCRSPKRLRGRSIMQLSEDDFCIDPTRRAIIISSGVAAFATAVLVALATLLYKLRFRFYKRWKFHPFDRDECAGEDMDYDVFLCCSGEDHEEHAVRIMDVIESKGYRVCYHVRDFRVGLVTDSIDYAIERSKRTVCLLTTHFVQSNWCLTEFDAAYQRNVAMKRKKRLIVLMALDNDQLRHLRDNDALDTATLRQYLRQYTYIDYTADDWLDRMLYALPLRGLLQQDAPAAEDDPLLIQHN